MNRPLLEGTKLHKASVLKAKKEPVVAQTRTKADPSLVAAGTELGKSYVPKEIDFTIDSPKIRLPEKRELTEAEIAARDARRQARKDKRAEKKRIKDLRSEYDREHPKGTLFPDGKYYDASGKEIKAKKERKKFNLGKRIGDWFVSKAGQIRDIHGNIVKGDKAKKAKDEIKEKEFKEKVKESKVEKDTWYNDVDKDGNVVTRSIKKIGDKIVDAITGVVLDVQEAGEDLVGDITDSIEANKERLAKKKAEQLKQQKIKDREEYERQVIENQLKKDKVTAAENYTVNKKDLVLKEGNWVPKKGAISKESDHAIWDGEQWTDNPKYMDKGEVQGLGRDKTVEIKVDKPIVQAFGETEIRNYNKEEQKRLLTEGVFNEDVGRTILPEEQDEDGNFIGKKEVDIIKDKKLDKKLIKATEESTMQMRDDRIWKNAVKDGPVHRNMRKSGYIPYNER